MPIDARFKQAIENLFRLGLVRRHALQGVGISLSVGVRPYTGAGTSWPVRVQ